jgi:hypothetical protein
MSPPGSIKGTGCGNAQGFFLTIATVSGRQKNAQIYTIERAQKMSSGRQHSADVVPGKEHAAYNRKLKNFI